MGPICATSTMSLAGGISAITDRSAANSSSIATTAASKMLAMSCRRVIARVISSSSFRRWTLPCNWAATAFCSVMSVEMPTMPLVAPYWSSNRAFDDR